ncbi:MAG: penicillin-binding transpeptidase domain-containing protein [Clostridia bacterium]|nr:penicillin-binding transpeptidase domain-containing protein [Clostridia bacterium]
MKQILSDEVAFMNRLLSAVLALVLLAVLLPLAGCDAAASADAVFTQYLDCLVAGDYSGMFAMLTPRVARDETDALNIEKDVYATAFYEVCGTRLEESDDSASLEPQIPPGTTAEQLAAVQALYDERIGDSLYLQTVYQSIPYDEFEAKHTAIFDALGVTDIAYSLNSVTDGVYLRSAAYTLTYHTARYGDLTYDFLISLQLSSAGEWQLAWSPSLIFPDMTWGDAVRSVKLPAQRGEIIMSSGVVAQNVAMYAITAETAAISDKAAAAALVAELIGQDADSVARRLDSSADVVTIGYLYPDEVTSYVRGALDTIPGFSIVESTQTMRYYPFGEMLAHLVGYAGYASAEEIEELNAELDEGEPLYSEGDVIGKSGLERTYESELRGVDGNRFIILRYDGSIASVICEEPAQDGLDVKLTIDYDLQARLEEVLDNTLYGENTSCAVVVMNPVTGELLATASTPTYDPNLFARGISQEDYEAYTSDKRAPFLCKLTASAYPPGSIIKPFIAAEALMDDVLSTDYVFSGTISDDYWTPTGFGTWVSPPIKRAQVNNRETPLNMRNALLHSDNIYFAYAALRIGEARLTAFLESLSMDEAIPFELSVAEPNILNERESDTPISLIADMGYGQGELLVTPLQMACMYSAFANGGDVIVPRIVEGLYAEEGLLSAPVSLTERAVHREGVLSQYAIAKIVPMLEDVVNPAYNGTGRPLRVSTYTIAGKTGTAEIGATKTRVISWFAGFRTGVDEEDARLVLIMLDVDNEDQYNAFKFQIAREMLE